MLLWFYKFPTDKLHPPKIKGTSEKPERLWGVSGVGWGGRSISETQFFLNAVPKPTWHTFPDSFWARTRLLQQEPSLFTFYSPVWKNHPLGVWFPISGAQPHSHAQHFQHGSSQDQLPSCEICLFTPPAPSDAPGARILSLGDVRTVVPDLQ